MNTYALPTNSARLDRRLVLSRNLGRVWDALLSGKIASAGGGGRGWRLVACRVAHGHWVHHVYRDRTRHTALR